MHHVLLQVYLPQQWHQVMVVYLQETDRLLATTPNQDKFRIVRGCGFTQYQNLYAAQLLAHPTMSIK